MSLILKGIDLPMGDQVIVIHSDGTFNEVDPFARRLMPFYKVIQIPKEHGNIIDESKAVVTETIDGYYEITAPTILEEENEFNTKRD